MGGDHPSPAGTATYAAIVDQDLVTDEVRDIALKYDPLNRSGREGGFYVTDDGELHIDDASVTAAHKIIEKKIPNDAIRIVRLPTGRGELVHQYGENGFRLYELPAPAEGRVVGLLGPNGLGKSTALQVLSGQLKPNLGLVDDEPDWGKIVREFRGTAVQTYLERLRDDDIETAYKPQRVVRLADRYAGTLRDLLAERDERGAFEEAMDAFDVRHVADRSVGDLSGGELQRAAIAATLVADVDTYLLDEPSSYLDVGQRLTVARALVDLAADRAVVVVDHDLVTLDVVADDVHVCYGEAGAFGVVSRSLSARRGINEYLAGHLRGENVRIRDEPLDFHRRVSDRGVDGPPVVAFPRLRTALDSFTLTVEPGTVHEGELLGIVGRNGLGKTTFARLLAGAIEPDEGAIESTATLSYKPQHVEPAFDGTVGELFESRVDAGDPSADPRVDPWFSLEPLLDRAVADLSGGELQRVAIVLALARDADGYVLDEPSAFLDVEQRMALARMLRRFVDRTAAPCLVVDHDLVLLEYLADRAMGFEGEPGVRGVARAPDSVERVLSAFLATVGVTFRTDPDTGRPRANKPGSQKDREQKAAGTYYAPD